MIRFTNGPAAGVPGLLLRRAPLYLRVVCHDGKWDALDQLDDRPEPGETIYAYRLVEQQGSVHINRGRRGSGFFVMATYTVVEPQPADATMRNNACWREWAETKAKAGEARCE